MKERISEEAQIRGKLPKAPFKTLDNVIDINITNEKVKVFPGYKHWAVEHNLSTMADTINQVRSEGFQSSNTLPTTKQIFEELEKLNTRKESLIEKLNQARQEQKKLYQYKKNYDTYLGKEVER